MRHLMKRTNSATAVITVRAMHAIFEMMTLSERVMSDGPVTLAPALAPAVSSASSESGMAMAIETQRRSTATHERMAHVRWPPLLPSGLAQHVHAQAMMEDPGTDTPVATMVMRVRGAPKMMKEKNRFTTLAMRVSMERTRVKMAKGRTKKKKANNATSSKPQPTLLRKMMRAV